MKHSLYIAAIMLLVLILSQGYWLYNIYNAEKYKTQEVLEELFEETIKQEMSKRMVSNKPKDPNKIQVSSEHNLVSTLFCSQSQTSVCHFCIQDRKSVV